MTQEGPKWPKRLFLAIGDNTWPYWTLPDDFRQRLIFCPETKKSISWPKAVNNKKYEEIGKITSQDKATNGKDGHSDRVILPLIELASSALSNQEDRLKYLAFQIVR